MVRICQSRGTNGAGWVQSLAQEGPDTHRKLSLCITSTMCRPGARWNSRSRAVKRALARNEDPAQWKVSNIKERTVLLSTGLGCPAHTVQPPSGEMDVCSSGPPPLLRTPAETLQGAQVLKKDKQGLIQRMTVGKVEQVGDARLEGCDRLVENARDPGTNPRGDGYKFGVCKGSGGS